MYTRVEYNLWWSSLMSQQLFPATLSALPATDNHHPNKTLRQLSLSNNPHNALLFFPTMLHNCFPINRFTFPPLLKAAAKSRALEEGKMVHALISKLGFHSDPFVETALVGMYGACGMISDARSLFDKMSHRDVVAWSTMIDSYCQSQLFDDVMVLLEDMKCSGMEPDARIYTTIVAACGRSGNLETGKLVHRLIPEKDILVDFHLQTALLNMYSASGSMDVAQSLYDKLPKKNVVASTAMISGYSRVGNIEAARLVFDKTVEKDVVCWSAMISGYANSDNPQEAIKIFHSMQQCGIKPERITMLSVISACAHLGALDQAKRIHKFVDENEYGKALCINNALIDMYAKCGSLKGAKEIFSRLGRKNVISWTSMINAFAVHGDAGNAFEYFEQMKLENVEPNWVTFVGILYACSHAGLVEEAEKLFHSMVHEYGIKPKLEHYGCMIDLYGRANRLREALELVETMPMAPNVVIWGSLMAACRTHGEVELGKFAAKHVLELDPNHDGAHVFLSNVYAKEKMWDNVGAVRQFMKEEGILKERGYSMIETDNEVHKFMTADKSHEQTGEIYAKLDEVVEKIKQVGYTPNTSCVLVDLDENEKKQAVLCHSEKLALCFGLIHGEKQSTIRIIKNLRICEDCHIFIKLASKVFNREIVVRDRSRFHHCTNGLCSCKDYW